jgi:hypothetical protein
MKALDGYIRPLPLFASEASRSASRAWRTYLATVPPRARSDRPTGLIRNRQYSYAQYTKSPKGCMYVAPNPSSTRLNSSLGVPKTVDRVRSTMLKNLPLNLLENVRKCASAEAESAYRS